MCLSATKACHSGKQQPSLQAVATRSARITCGSDAHGLSEVEAAP